MSSGQQNLLKKPWEAFKPDSLGRALPNPANPKEMMVQGNQDLSDTHLNPHNWNRQFLTSEMANPMNPSQTMNRFIAAPGTTWSYANPQNPAYLRYLANLEAIKARAPVTFTKS